MTMDRLRHSEELCHRKPESELRTSQGVLKVAGKPAELGGVKDRKQGNNITDARI